MDQNQNGQKAAVLLYMFVMFVATFTVLCSRTLIGWAVGVFGRTFHEYGTLLAVRCWLFIGGAACLAAFIFAIAHPSLTTTLALSGTVTIAVISLAGLEAVLNHMAALPPKDAQLTLGDSWRGVMTTGGWRYGAAQHPPVPPTCPDCHGTGLCRFCRAVPWWPCSICFLSGRCRRCGGHGFVLQHQRQQHTNGANRGIFD